jgi:hypothetical protein
MTAAIQHVTLQTKHNMTNVNIGITELELELEFVATNEVRRIRGEKCSQNSRKSRTIKPIWDILA